MKLPPIPPRPRQATSSVAGGPKERYILNSFASLLAESACSMCNSEG